MNAIKHCKNAILKIGKILCPVGLYLVDILCDELDDLCLQLRKKLRSEQMDREKEQVDQAAMLRELNKNLSERIRERDDLLHQVYNSIHHSGEIG